MSVFPTNSERLIGISDAFSAFVYGYSSSCPRAQCVRDTRRHGRVYTGHACRHLPSVVPWISEDRLFCQAESEESRRASHVRAKAEKRSAARETGGFRWICVKDLKNNWDNLYILSFSGYRLAAEYSRLKMCRTLAPYLFSIYYPHHLVARPLCQILSPLT